jgi:hypothetical protein
MNSASLCSQAGRYENPIPPRCLAPIDFLKIPAQALADSLNLSSFHRSTTYSPQIQKTTMNQTVAKFIVPNWGDKVNSELHRLAGGYDNPMTAQPESTITPS